MRLLALMLAALAAGSAASRGAPAAPAPTAFQETAPAPTATLSYGPAARQQITLYRPVRGGRGRPLVLYVHGGGWAAGSHKSVYGLPDWANRTNIWFGSVGYRYLPQAPVETQAADIGAAIRKAQREARRHGYAADRIILMGHSSGAHLAALVATDPRYAGTAFTAIRAVITVDGSAFHVPVQLASGQGEVMRQFRNAFGADAKRQAALSPALQAGPGDVPRWLLIHVRGRGGAAAQAVLLGAALEQAKLDVQAKAVPGDHMGLIRNFGAPGYPAEADVDALIRTVAAN